MSISPSNLYNNSQRITELVLPICEESDLERKMVWLSHRARGSNEAKIQTHVFPTPKPLNLLLNHTKQYKGRKGNSKGNKNAHLHRILYNNFSGSTDPLDYRYKAEWDCQWNKPPPQSGQSTAQSKAPVCPVHLVPTHPGEENHKPRALLVNRPMLPMLSVS